MNDLPRSTIDELIARYELEPDLRDMYVEGDADIEILQRCCHDRWVLYSIDAVNISGTDLRRYGLTEGRKQRVIALAHELFAALGRVAPNYRCLVDRDLDHWFGSLDDTPGLIYTEYASIELYFLSEELIWELVIVTGKASISNWADFFQSLIDCLLDIYSLRLADRALALSADWPPVQRNLEKQGCTVALDLVGYTRKVLMKIGAMPRQADFDANVKSWRGKFNDPRLAIRGHDLVDLLAWVIREFEGVPQLAHANVITRLLVLLAPRIDDLQRLVP